MPQPQPLSASRPYTSNYDYQPLTPRTPHSRAGRAEEQPVGDDYELEVIHGLGDTDGSNANYQSEPLLASSASATFPHRIRTFEDSERERKYKRIELSPALILSRLPLVAGATVAMFLFFLIVMSMKRPESLRKVIGVTPVHSSPTEEKPVGVFTSMVAPSPSEEPSTKVLSYENYSSFPLSPNEYREECAKWFKEVMKGTPPYWYVPPGGPMDVVHHDELHNQKTHLPEAETKKVCRSTITYLLDGRVGLAADIALMAQAAALARERNRTFFVHDQSWNRGRWIDYFQDVRHRQPGPEPDCLPPPPEELVACPRSARHWVINSRTAVFHFGSSFDNEYEDPYARHIRRKRPIYDNAIQSFAQTIRPNAEIAALIRSARKEIKDSVSTRNDDSADHDMGVYVGVHIRRGDRKAEAWPHRGQYVPITDFVTAAREAWTRLLPGSILSPSQPGPVVWVASDSPEAQEEFLEAEPGAGPAIKTTVFSLARSKNDKLRALASQREYVQSEFDSYPFEERVNATKGALIDFALLSGAWVWDDEARPMASVCTISSDMCKLAAVGLGWDRAFGFSGNSSEENIGKAGEFQNEIDNERKRWIDIDSRGIIEPAWRPFELF